MTLTILCSCSGEEYFRLNAPSFLASIESTYPSVLVRMATINVPDTLLRRASARFPFLRVQRIHEDECWPIVRHDDDFFGANKELIASAKTLPWKLLYNEHARPGDHLLFCDVDVVHLKSVESYFKRRFDVAYTYYSTPHPVAAGPDPSTIFGPRLNSGVILAKAGPAARAFFRRWENLSARIEAPLYYGGHDQDALVWLLTGRTKRSRIDAMPRRVTLSLYGVQTEIIGLPCKELNEPEAIGPIPAYTRILHFKGEWKPLLKDGWKPMRGTLRDKPFALPQYEVWRSFRAASGLTRGGRRGA